MTAQAQQTNGKTTAQAAPPKSQVDAILDNTVTYRPFMADSDITLTPRTIMGYFAKPTKQGHLPTPQQAAKFVMLCKARALNPWEGDAFIVGYDTQDGPEFNLITAHQAFLKRAEIHPEFDGMESGVTVKLANGELIDQPGDYVDEGQTLVGGWARVHFKNRKIPTYRRVKLATYSTGRSRWNKDAAGMIVKVAEADSLRSSFPTKLGGIYLREEFDAVAHDATAKPTIAMPRAVGEPAPPSAPTPEQVIIETEEIVEPESPEETSQEIPADPHAALKAEWQAKLDKDPNLEQVNKLSSELPDDKEQRKIAWDMLVSWCKANGVSWDKKTKAFVRVEEGGA